MHLCTCPSLPLQVLYAAQMFESTMAALLLVLTSWFDPIHFRAHCLREHHNPPWGQYHAKVPVTWYRAHNGQ